MAAMTKAELATENDALRKSLSREAAKRKVLERRCATLSETRREAREQQVATAEILRLISSSPTDLQLVMDTVAERAARLCEASDAQIFRLDGDAFHLAASHGPLPPAQLVPVTRGSVAGRAVIDRQTIHIRDIGTEPSSEFPDSLAKGSGWRTVLAVPLVRDGVPIGAILIRRMEVRPFSDKQLALLKTFADQAVIAIENVRLFKELEARNRDLSATSEILRVISRSPTDIQPVMNAVAENAARLCDAEDALIQQIDVDVFRVAAHFGTIPVDHARTMPVSRNLVSGRAALERTSIHVHDMLEEGTRRDFPVSAEFQRRVGFRTLLATPLMLEATAIGAIVIRRLDVRPFTDKQIALLQTFAAQAVIAIENVRLFTELQARSREITEALEQQTATAEILRVISGSPTDVQPVFDEISRSAARLTEAQRASVILLKSGALHRVSGHHSVSVGPDWYPRPLSADTLVGRSILARAVVNTPDVLEEQGLAALGGGRGLLRAQLTVPMLRDGEPIGAIAATRQVPGPFSERQIVLLQTFADQAVIAIENVRLFNELADKSQQLEAASRHKSEFLANMSHELRTPLNAVIGFSEVLLQRMFGELNAKQDEYLKDIYASGQHLLSLINDILDLSKIEAGRMELTAAPFHLPSALENAVTLVRERAGRHGIGLQVDIDPRLGELVGDERKIKQVLLNLLSNAVKFTPEGGRISLKASRKDGLVEIAVTDTGIGIAPEDQAAIFEEFRQVGSDETRKQEGTGLGLTLAKKFIELHGGRIWVESELVRGSTFTFTLPVS